MMLHNKKTNPEMKDKNHLPSALTGCIFGLMCGDALGASVEFMEPHEIKAIFPEGVREMLDGQTFIPRKKGVITDDSEMALCLMDSLATAGTWDRARTLKNYQLWLATDPPDVGQTCLDSLNGTFNPNSQANGAMMRIAPLACWAATHPELDWQTVAEEDCKLTHIHQVCVDANKVYVYSIMQAIKSTHITPRELYDKTLAWAKANSICPQVMEGLAQAALDTPPAYVPCVGWVLRALPITYYQLLHAPNYEEAMVEVVSSGGDPDTNAAICGALLGALYGIKAIPNRWLKEVVNANPTAHKDAMRFCHACLA